MNGHYSTSYIFYRLVLWGVLVFVIMKTKREGSLFSKYYENKTPKFTVKFDLKVDGKNRTEDNLTD